MINISYNATIVSAAGITESTLRIWLWNATSSTWIAINNSGVDTANGIVWANGTMAGNFGVFGTIPSSGDSGGSSGGSSEIGSSGGSTVSKKTNSTKIVSSPLEISSLIPKDSDTLFSVPSDDNETAVQLACGNNVCGVDETPELCPRDCSSQNLSGSATGIVSNIGIFTLSILFVILFIILCFLYFWSKRVKKVEM